MVTWNKDLLDGEGGDVATKNREALRSQLMSSFEVSVSVQDLCFLQLEIKALESQLIYHLSYLLAMEKHLVFHIGALY